MIHTMTPAVTDLIFSISESYKKGSARYLRIERFLFAYHKNYSLNNTYAASLLNTSLSISLS